MHIVTLMLMKDNLIQQFLLLPILTDNAGQLTPILLLLVLTEDSDIPAENKDMMCSLVLLLLLVLTQLMLLQYCNTTTSIY